MTDERITIETVLAGNDRFVDRGWSDVIAFIVADLGDDEDPVKGIFLTYEAAQSFQGSLLS